MAHRDNGEELVEEELFQQVHIKDQEFSGSLGTFADGLLSNVFGGGGGRRGYGGPQYGGGGPNMGLNSLFGRLLEDKLPRLVGDLAHRYLGIDPQTGRILGAMAGNVLFNLGGRDNILGKFGKVILDNMISGKWRRKVDPYVPPQPVPVQPEPSGPGPLPPRPTPTPAGGQDFYSLRDECLKRRKLYEDPDFPANDSSLFFSQRPPKRIEWRRPGEIVREPILFNEGATRFDVQQGELGDCWMLAGIAILTLRDELFYRVVPPDQSFTENYCGIFHFQFWQYGKWVDVVIDDRLPTYRGKLMYMHSADHREFWSALLEKAYAKLHGSYEGLKGGTTCEALEDFTGGITELINLKEDPPKNLLQLIFKSFEMGSLLACSIQGHPGQIGEQRLGNGLLSGHAYSITGVKVVNGPDGKTPLLRIRNPWGNEAEWRGPWSDGSREWRYVSNEEKKSIGLVFAHDGEFWMSFDDFVRNFETLEICNLGPEVMEEVAEMTGVRPKVSSEWTHHQHHGKWIRNRTAGGCANNRESFPANPQLLVSLKDPDPYDDDNLCTVIFGVIQKYRRQLKPKGLDMLPIGFAVFKIRTTIEALTFPNETIPQKRKQIRRPRLAAQTARFQGVGEPGAAWVDRTPGGRLDGRFFRQNRSVARSPVFINLREVCGRFRLPCGNYVILPSTYQPNQEGDFMVRIYSDKPSVSRGLA